MSRSDFRRRGTTTLGRFPSFQDARRFFTCEKLTVFVPPDEKGFLESSSRIYLKHCPKYHALFLTRFPARVYISKNGYQLPDRGVFSTLPSAPVSSSQEKPVPPSVQKECLGGSQTASYLQAIKTYQDFALMPENIQVPERKQTQEIKKAPEIIKQKPLISCETEEEAAAYCYFCLDVLEGREQTTFRLLLNGAQEVYVRQQRQESFWLWFWGRVQPQLPKIDFSVFCLSEYLEYVREESTAAYEVEGDLW